MFGGDYGGGVYSNDIFIMELTTDTVVVRYQLLLLYDVYPYCYSISVK